MIDRAAIGRETARTEVQIERGRLQLFARVLGQTDPVYSDLAQARAAGHPDLPVPPTFLMGLEIETEDVYRTLESLGVPLGDVLHGEQEFTYCRPVHAGDTVALTTRIADVYERKAGRLEFLVRETRVDRDDELVARMRSVLVVTHREGNGGGEE
jgi:acyl dehydratase